MATPLKLALTVRDVKQGDLAQRVGIGVTAMSDLVRGKSQPNVVTALKIARELGMTVEELWGWLITDNTEE